MIAVLQAVSIFMEHGALKPAARETEPEACIQGIVRIGVFCRGSHRKQTASFREAGEQAFRHLTFTVQYLDHTNPRGVIHAK